MNFMKSVQDNNYYSALAGIAEDAKTDNPLLACILFTVCGTMQMPDIYMEHLKDRCIEFAKEALQEINAQL